MSENSPVELKIDSEGIVTLTINRPKALNSLNAATLDALDKALSEVEANRDARAVIITGAGDRAFVAGADISTMPDMSSSDAREFSARGSKLFRRLEKLRLPVIAAVNGFALGGGCELALACDFIYASEKAKFGQPEVNLGIIAGFGGTQRLPARVGPSMAMELLLTGRTIDAQEALRIGLANRVLPADELMDAVQATLKEILSRGPKAVALSKALVYKAADLELDDGLAAETDAFADVFKSAQAKEGVQAFLEKRRPDFKGL